MTTDQEMSSAVPVRRQVVVNGERVRTIDVHAHCAVPEAVALFEAAMPSKVPAIPQLLLTDPARLRAMDEQGIDVEVLSVNPYWYGASRDLAQELITIQNEYLAAYCESEPDRFVALASVSLQYPDLAAAQLEDGVRRLGLRGASVGGSVEGRELADPDFHPFFAKAEEIGALVFIHPQGCAELATSGRLSGNGVLTNTIANPLETTIALSHLIFEGTLDRFPGLRILAAHGGGYLPSYAARSDAVLRTFPDQVSPPGTLAKAPTEYLRQLYYDTIVFTPEALRHLAAETGAAQLMMGTDYPYPWTSTSVDHILTTPGLSDDERVAILGGTAQRLLGLNG
ncbi:MAG TPA: amidohydrolase family protein [Acidimicrobiales bacterium]